MLIPMFMFVIMLNIYNFILSIGMDQNKCHLPHFVTDSKGTSSLNKLKTHLLGAIVHGHGNYGFVDYNQYPHDANLTIHALVSILSMMTSTMMGRSTSAMWSQSGIPIQISSVDLAVL